MTPLMCRAAPSVVTNISRYARRRSSFDSQPIEANRFLMVPLLSSAARMPLPGATNARAMSLSDVIGSLPFNRARRFGGDVVGDPIHAWNLVDNPARDPFQHVVGQTCPIRGHRVVG